MRNIGIRASEKNNSPLKIGLKNNKMKDMGSKSMGNICQ